MNRKGLGVLIASGAIGAGVIVACGEKILDDGIPDLGGDSGGNGTGSCWPTDPVCYGGGTKDSPGGECMSVRDNSPIDANGIQKIQLRQRWVSAITPKGNNVEYVKNVYNALNNYTQLKMPECNESSGASGYIQLFDFTLNTTNSTGDSWVGFAKYVPEADISSTLTNGFCMVDDTWANDGYALPDSQMTAPTGWPTGLPRPMGRATTPWHVKPTHAKRLAADFDLNAPGNGFPTKREELLASFEPLGENDGYDGVFYYDPATGKSHGYAKMSFLIIYDQPTKYIAVPIREPETRSTFNDKDHPNCIGAYRADALDPNSGCKASTTVTDEAFPAWGCPNGSCPRGESPATTEGYFLITELEQIYATLLQSTLCVSYPTFSVSDADGWAVAHPSGGSSCSTSPQWNPADPVAGIPNGDWCAATNSVATPTCHDSYRSFSYHVFAGAPVKSPVTAEGGVGTCTAF